MSPLIRQYQIKHIEQRENNLRSAIPHNLDERKSPKITVQVQKPQQMTQIRTEYFPPAKRLRCRNDFTAVFSKANHRFKQGKLQLLAVEHASDDARLGLIIPKKMLKKAVHRNRLKRIIRDNFRRQQWPVTCDIIIALKQKIDPNELYQQDIHITIQNMLSRLKKYTQKV